MSVDLKLELSTGCSSFPRAQAAQLIRVHYELQKGAFIADFQQAGDSIRVFSDISSLPMWNHAAWLGGGGEAQAQFFDETSLLWPRHDRRPVVYLIGAESDALHPGSRWVPDGFEQCDQEAWMVCVDPPSGLSHSSGRLEIRVAQSTAEISEFIRIFCAAYQADPKTYANALIASHRDKGDARRAFYYIAYFEGAPVCIASVLALDDFGGIYNVGTLPSARRRGFAAELLSFILREVSREFPRGLFLQAEKGGSAEQLYSKLGFRTEFVRTGYRLADWKPARKESLQIPASGAVRIQPVEFLNAFYRDESGPAEAKREASTTLEVPPQLEAAISTFCLQHPFGPAAVWAAAWAVLLSRYSREMEISFGVADAPDQLSVVRLFVPEEDSAIHWLQRVEEQLLALESSSSGTGSESPGVESIIYIHSGRLGQKGRMAPVELYLPQRTGEALQIVYDACKFDQTAIERISGHLFTLLQELIQNPDQALGALDILTESERQCLLIEWNPPVSDRGERTVHQLFGLAAEQAPDHIAVQLAAFPERNVNALTYRELHQRTNQLARHLQSIGVGPEKVVGLCLERSVEMVVGLLAIFKAGGVCLPLDSSYPRERLEWMLRDSNAFVILAQASVRTTLPATTARILVLEEEASRIAAHSDGNLDSKAHPDQAAYVIYTSGSTGKPKGVVITHRAIASHCLDARSLYELTSHDRVLQFNSLSFDAAFEQILSTIISGATLVVRGPEVWSVTEFSQHLAASRLTVIDIPTAYWNQVLQHWVEDPSRIPSSLPRLWIVGGEAMGVEALALWRLLPPRNLRLLNAYGPTETTITATVFEITPAFLDALPRRVPIGRPRGARTAYILSGSMRPVPVGVVGELFLGGPLLARGYLNRDELTRERFLPNPFGRKGDRLYRTGDLARYLPDGNIEFLGRVDQQVKIRGFRIELGEVETALLQHPQLRESAVVLREASGQPSLAAYYVLKNGAGPSERELRHFLQERLPDYMVPSSFVALDQLPLLPGGKIDRRTLSLTEAPASTTAVTGARDPLELRLRLLFERILGRTGVGVDSGFFELGGNSLQALELIVEIERMSGRSLPLETLYQTPTVEALARLLQQEASFSEASSLVLLQSGDSRPPLFLIHTTPGDILGYGNLIYHLDPGQTCFGLQSLGLLQSELSHHRIPEMAAYYVGLIRSRVSEGPYFLAGWCYGGIVAFEMAQQLTALGEKVAFLGLLETVAPPPSLSVHRYYRHRVKCFLRMKPAHWVQYLRKKLTYYREVKLANKMRFRRLDRSAEQDTVSLQAHNEKLANLEHVYNTNLHALKFYRPRPYPGRITLFNAHEVDVGIIPDPLYAWPGLANEVEVHSVPGDHDTMLTEPNVATLARKLGECLRRAQGRRAAEIDDAKMPMLISAR